MTRHFSIKALAMFAIAIFIATIAPQTPADGGGDDTKKCTLANVAAQYGCTTTGFTAMDGTPVAAVGRFSLDRFGNVTGTQTIHIDDQVATDTFFSITPITVNADCTGTGMIVNEGNLPFN